MSKIRVLADHVANQIAAGEVVERPASVAKELVENSIDARARRVTVEIEAGGRKLLRVVDDGEGMTRDDAVLAFERHATSKISGAEDLFSISTLGFRGEALASIASVARVELVTCTEGEPAATRVLMEGGRMRDVGPAAHPRGTTISVRDLFFNLPARRKFLRSEATESFHLTNLVTHYALAHPEIYFTLTNNGREVLRAAPAPSLRERAYQIFGAEFLENLLEVEGGHPQVARVRGFVSAPRERRTSRDAQYLFVNGRFVRDRVISRALSEAYRGVLPQGTFPVALLFLEVPLEEVDVNVHPAKTEVRFRRAAAVGDTLRETVRAALSGYLRTPAPEAESNRPQNWEPASPAEPLADASPAWAEEPAYLAGPLYPPAHPVDRERPASEGAAQTAIEFSYERISDEAWSAAPLQPAAAPSEAVSPESAPAAPLPEAPPLAESRASGALPPLVSALGLVREMNVENLSGNIRPLGQLGESYIIATDEEGLLLIDQHVAHERILFERYQTAEASRAPESQHLLLPEVFDLSPAQAAVFESVAEELESYGFHVMLLSGRTVAVKSVPADLPPGETRNLLAEVLETADAERRGGARTALRVRIAAALACRAAVKNRTPLTTEKMRWIIDRLLATSSPTTSPHGRPALLRLTTRDLEKGFQRA